MILILPFLVGLANASIFDFFQNQFHTGGQQEQQPEDFEQKILNSQCSNYICPDTSACVSSPNDCPCAFPNSQLRCVLPDAKYMCISKPAGEVSYHYDDPNSNMDVDLQDDNVRDCGWVKRAYAGLV
ncbi:long chronological lifespan protein 2 [[Candida] railenensis]|uniref:Long chronological lifespan protein 2 n=1 Tax=[Candida] railenensis TaxID=45579 RepID=A0A9P0QTC7_9ASCO|nr:long chronological lifespan protein 2 [[Candida] railenensis]